MTLTEETDTTIYYASMESEYSSFEENLFLNISATRVVSTAGNYTQDSTITDNEAVCLNGGDVNRGIESLNQQNVHDRGTPTAMKVEAFSRAVS